MQTINEVFIRETGCFFYKIVGEKVRISWFLHDDFRMESVKIVVVQLRSAVGIRGDIDGFCDPINPRVVFLEPRHTKDNIFFTTVCDIEQDFMGNSANAEEKCGRKFNFSTRVDRGVDVSDGDRGREFRVGKTIFLDKVIVEAIDTCPRIDESAG